MDEEVQLYDRLVAQSGEAFERRMYETAYHCMAGALYAARAIGDDARLIDIAFKAAEHQFVLDEQVPTHPMASRPGRTGFFRILQRLALHHHDLVNYQRFRRRLQPPPSPTL